MVYCFKGFTMIINEESYTYQDFTNKLTSSERDLMVKIFSIMNEDNLMYLYQTVSKRDNRRYIDKVAEELNVTIKRVQNMISDITAKQDTDRYFIYKTNSSIRGEYFINPNLALKSAGCYDEIYKSVIPKLERENKI